VIAPTATNADPAIGGGGVSKIVASGTTGIFTIGASGLLPATAYSFKAYATNSAGTTYTTPASTFATPSNDASLAALVLTTATLSPPFAGGITSYATSVPNATTSITVTPTVAQASATVKVNAVSVPSGSASPAIALAAGANLVTVVVTAQDGVTTRSYSLTVTRLAPPSVTSPTSTAITATGATLGGNVTSDGGAAISERGIVYAATAANADPTIGGTGVVQLTSPGTTGVFAVAAGGLTPCAGYSFKAYAINSEGTTYSAASTFSAGTVPPSVTSPTSTGITATAATLGGTVTSDGGAPITERGVVLAPTATNADPAIGGAGVVNVVAGGTVGAFTVSATGLVNGTAYSFKAYAINAQGPSYSAVASVTTLSSNANLSALVVDTAVLSPAFASATTSYSSSVPNATASVTVTPTVAQANATVKVGGAVVASGAPSAPIGLSPGPNLITVVVTAEDGVTTKTYAIAVTRITTPTIVAPTAASVTALAAMLGGNVTSDGGAAITERGIVYATVAASADPQIGGAGVTKVSTPGTTGIFAASVNGLTPGTGYAFKAYATNSVGTSYTTVAGFSTPNAVLDIDGDGNYDALTDGLLAIRYLFGLTGNALTNAAVAPGATRSDPLDVEGYLDSIEPLLDVDGDGNPDALTDGLVIVRYMFGLRGAALVAGATSPGGTRTTAEIEAYIQGMMQ